MEDLEPCKKRRQDEPAGEAVPDKAEVYVENGVRAQDKEYGADSMFSITPVIDAEAVSISGTTVSTDEYSGAFFVATGDTSESNISTTDIDLGASYFNGDAGHAVSVGSGAFVSLDNVNISVDGSVRYATYVVEDGRLVVRNSSVRSTGAADGDGGSEPASNSPLLIYGMSRTNMSVGESRTYYLNSTVAAEGWAALSTDSATGDGLELRAYNTDAEAENGGYATYADTDCRVYLYGCDLRSPEIGAIISKNGIIQVLDGDAADDTTISYLGAEDERTTEGSVLTGGRNAVMLHAPDMMGEGVPASDTGSLSVVNSSLETNAELASNAVTDYTEKYGAAVGAYVEHIKGSLILVKSTSGNISLDGATLKSYSGTLVHTIINNDSMGNFLLEGDADNASVYNVNITMANMSAAGNFLHEDYQRYMRLNLDNSTLEGAVIPTSFDEWRAMWSDYGSVNWLPDTSWETVNGVDMRLENNSKWIVTGTSTLSSLEVDDTSSVTAPEGRAVIVAVDGIVSPLVAGKSYVGKITVSLQ